MHLENWTYRVLCGKARTGKISKQQVLSLLIRHCTDGLSESALCNEVEPCWGNPSLWNRLVGWKVCGRTNVGGIILKVVSRYVRLKQKTLSVSLGILGQGAREEVK